MFACVDVLRRELVKELKGINKYCIDFCSIYNVYQFDSQNNLICTLIYE